MTISLPPETHSAAATLAAGEQLAAQLAAGAVLALHGELGAGKTCLVKGIARGLGIAQPITSPTFTLLNEYRTGRLPLYHIDLYRLDGVAQAVEIGIEDYLPSDGITVIEWAERIAELLPPQTIHIHLSWLDDTTRRLELK